VAPAIVSVPKSTLKAVLTSHASLPMLALGDLTSVVLQLAVNQSMEPAHQHNRYFPAAAVIGMLGTPVRFDMEKDIPLT
jgi:hypothetical protein